MIRVTGPLSAVSILKVTDEKQKTTADPLTPFVRRGGRRSLRMTTFEVARKNWHSAKLLRLLPALGPAILLQNLFAQAQRLWRDLNKLIVGNELYSLF